MRHAPNPLPIRVPAASAMPCICCAPRSCLPKRFRTCRKQSRAERSTTMIFCILYLKKSEFLLKKKLFSMQKKRGSRKNRPASEKPGSSQSGFAFFRNGDYIKPNALRSGTMPHPRSEAEIFKVSLSLCPSAVITVPTSALPPFTLEAVGGIAVSRTEKRLDGSAGSGRSRKRRKSFPITRE